MRRFNPKTSPERTPHLVNNEAVVRGYAHGRMIME